MKYFVLLLVLFSTLILGIWIGKFVFEPVKSNETPDWFIEYRTNTEKYVPISMTIEAKQTRKRAKELSKTTVIISGKPKHKMPNITLIRKPIDLKDIPLYDGTEGEKDEKDH